MQVNTTLTIYRNYQKVVLQETPGSGPAGRLPRSIEVILLNDLIDIAKPGEAVEVTGQPLQPLFMPELVLLKSLLMLSLLRLLQVNQCQSNLPWKGQGSEPAN